MDSEVENLKLWKKNNAKAMCWIMSSVEPYIGFNLRMYTTTVEMWNSLKNVNSQGNDPPSYKKWKIASKSIFFEKTGV